MYSNLYLTFWSAISSLFFGSFGQKILHKNNLKAFSLIGQSDRNPNFAMILCKKIGIAFVEKSFKESADVRTAI